LPRTILEALASKLSHRDSTILTLPMGRLATMGKRVVKRAHPAEIFIGFVPWLTPNRAKRVPIQLRLPLPNEFYRTFRVLKFSCDRVIGQDAGK
jgi:hypothetical protein